MKRATAFNQAILLLAPKVSLSIPDTFKRTIVFWMLSPCSCQEKIHMSSSSLIG